MFPYRDENETIRTPYATFVLIALNVAAWLLVQGAGSPWPWRGPSATSGSSPAS